MYDGLKNLEVPRRPNPGAKRALKVALVGVVALAVLFAGVEGYAFLRVNSSMRRARIEADVVPPLPKGPMNILVLGSDRRDVVDPELRNKRQYKGGGGQRADTIMLVHLAPEAKQAVLVSFPRDLRVQIPGHGFDKINAAYMFGGPNLMIKTVTRLTGLPINHYVEVNFEAFRAIVNRLGGVTMYFPKPLEDKKSGLRIEHSGCVKLDGDMALSFVRARYIYPNADLGRIQTQQRFIRALLGKVKSVSFLLNPGKTIGFAQDVSKKLRFDKGVDLTLARAIAGRLAGYDQGRMDFRMYPGTPQFIHRRSFIVPNQRQARLLFRAIGADAPLPDYGKTSQSVPEPADVSVRVMNGTGQTGLAATQASRLRKLGYRVTGVGTAGTQTGTVIEYTAGSELKAALILRQFPDARTRTAPRGQAIDIVVTIGSDFVAATASPGASPSASKKPAPPKPVVDTTCRG